MQLCREPSHTRTHSSLPGIECEQTEEQDSEASLWTHMFTFL